MSTSKIYKLDDRITFGKHKGKLILTLIDEAPEYLIWAHKNVAFFKLEESIYKSLLEDQKDQDDDREDDELLKECYDPNE